MQTLDQLRVPGELDAKTLELLRLVHEKFSKTGNPIPGAQLRFDFEVDHDRLAELDKAKLLEGRSSDRWRPTPLALLHLAHASDILAGETIRALRRLLQLTRERYDPSRGATILLSSEFPSHTLPALIAFANELGIHTFTLLENSTTEWTFLPAEQTYLLGTLEKAYEKTYQWLYKQADEQRGRISFRALPLQVRLRGIRTTRFRALRDATLELRPLTVLVGRNGAGKSTVLDAAGFVSRALTDGLRHAVADQGGIRRLRTRGTSGPVEVGLDFDIDHGDGSPVSATYELAIDAIGDSPIVEREELRLRGRDAVKRTLSNRRGKITLERSDGLSVERLTGAATLALRETFGEPLLQDVCEALQRILLIDRDPVLLLDEGSLYRSVARRRNAVPVDHLLRPLAADEAKLEELAAYAKELIPSIAGLVRVLRPDGPPFFEVREKGIEGTFALDELSAGTRQALLLCAAYLMDPPPTALLLEEPDGGVHPGSLPELADLLRSIAQRFPVLVTTHSPEFIGKLDSAAEVVAVDRDEEGVRFSPLSDAVKSKKWLASFGSTAEAFKRAASVRRA